MSTTVAFIFGLLAGIGWGTGPIASKKAYQNGGSAISAIVVQTSIGVISLWFISVLYYGLGDIVNLSVATIYPFVIAGLVASVIGRFLLYTGIDRVGASINSSIAATDPFFAVIVAFVFLQETPSKLQLVGCILAVIGVVVVASSGGGNKSGWKNRLVFIPLLAASLYGIGAVIRRYGFEITSVPPIIAATINETTAIVVWVGVGILTDVGIYREVSSADYRYLLLTGLLYTFGTVSMFVSLNAGPVIIGTTLGSTAGVISVLGSRLWLGDIESVTRTVIIGSVITVLGVILLSV